MHALMGNLIIEAETQPIHVLHGTCLFFHIVAVAAVIQYYHALLV